MGCTSTTAPSLALSTRQLQAPAGQPCPSGSLSTHVAFPFLKRYYLLRGGRMPHLCLGRAARAHGDSRGLPRGLRRQQRKRFPAHPDPGCAAAEVKNKINPVPAFVLLRSFSFSPIPWPALVFLIKLQASILFS